MFDKSYRRMLKEGAKILIAPNGHNEGPTTLEKILNEVLKGYSWHLESLNPRIYANPQILVCQKDVPGIENILRENDLLYEN